MQGDGRVRESSRSGGSEDGSPQGDILSECPMRVTDLRLPPEAIGFLRQECEWLYKMQEDSVRAGVLEGKSVLVSAPTSGGKTLVALMGILSCLSRNAGRAVYLCPMRSLAGEKYKELKELESIKINDRTPRVARSISGYGGAGEDLEGAHVVVMTNERLDVLLRRGSGWAEGLGTLVVDEIHMVGDRERGPTLESVIAHAMSMERPPQIIGLSATAPNAQEIADWLGARLVQSDKRPVPLYEGIYDGRSVSIEGIGALEVEQSSGYAPAVRVGIASVLKGDQTIIFAEKKQSAVSMAKKVAEAVGDRFSRGSGAELGKLVSGISGSGELTEETRTLASLVGRGVAFHHAGLGQGSRDLVERGFREGLIRLVASTSTLAVGVNLPARRVVISKLERYDYGSGEQEPITVREYKQMAGRAGRPRHDSVGEAITTVDCPNVGDARKKYIEGRPEPIESQMAGDGRIRAHLLGLVAIRPGITEGGAVDFFLRTLAGFQAGRQEIGKAVAGGLEFLRSGGLVEARAGGGGVSYSPSRVGALASRLYLEPSVAMKFRDVAKLELPKGSHTLGLLYAARAYGNMHGGYTSRADREHIEELLAGHSDGLFAKIRDMGDDVSKPELVLWLWINEHSLPGIADKTGVQPGTVHSTVDRASRLLYCISRIAHHAKNYALAKEAEALSVRTRHGILPELLDLVKLDGVGRAFARSMHDAGYRDRSSLGSLTHKELAKITKGEKTARKILGQVV